MSHLPRASDLAGRARDVAACGACRRFAAAAGAAGTLSRTGFHPCSLPSTTCRREGPDADASLWVAWAHRRTAVPVRERLATRVGRAPRTRRRPPQADPPAAIVTTAPVDATATQPRTRPGGPPRSPRPRVRPRRRPHLGHDRTRRTPVASSQTSPAANPRSPTKISAEPSAIARLPSPAASSRLPPTRPSRRCQA